MKARARAGKIPMVLGQRGYGVSCAIVECWSFAFTYYMIFLHVSCLLQILIGGEGFLVFLCHLSDFTC